MKVENFYLNITTEDPDGMFAFYRDTLGLPVMEGMGPHAVNAAGAIIGFDTHSNVHGPAKEPERYLIDLWVQDVKAEQDRLESQGITFVRKEGIEDWGGVISSFADPDGNIVQLFQYKPEFDKTREGAAATA